MIDVPAAWVNDTKAVGVCRRAGASYHGDGKQTRRPAATQAASTSCQPPHFPKNKLLPQQGRDLRLPSIGCCPLLFWVQKRLLVARHLVHSDVHCGCRDLASTHMPFLAKYCIQAAVAP